MKTITIKLTQEQYNRIMLKKEQAGFRNTSQYIRSMLLKNNFSTEKLIREIHYAVVRKES